MPRPWLLCVRGLYRGRSGIRSSCIIAVRRLLRGPPCMLRWRARSYPPCHRSLNGRIVDCSNDARGQQHKRRHDQREVDRIRRLKVEEGGLRDAKVGCHRAICQQASPTTLFLEYLDDRQPKVGVSASSRQRKLFNDSS